MEQSWLLQTKVRVRAGFEPDFVSDELVTTCDNNDTLGGTKSGALSIGGSYDLGNCRTI